MNSINLITFMNVSTFSYITDQKRISPQIRIRISKGMGDHEFKPRKEREGEAIRTIEMQNPSLTKKHDHDE